MTDIAIVDDHGLLAETLRLALERSGFACVRVTPAVPVELVPAVLTLRPSLVLLDLDLGSVGDSTPAIGGLTAGGAKVLVVTGTTDRMKIASALESGAIGHLSKSEDFDVLVRRAGEALQAHGPLDPAERAQLLAELRAARATHAEQWAPFQRLTERERATLRELARGRSVHQIAHSWVVSETTMRTHVRRLLDKLQVGSQLAAVALATEVGWLE